MFGAATQNGVGLGVGNIPTLTSLAYPQMLNAIVLGAFSGGAPGWLYDDSRMDTLFQDAAGTTPVTALEQPVGLQLDLSQGLVLGTELFANSNFASGLTGWDTTGTVAPATTTVNGSNQLVLYSIGATYARAGQGIATVAGKWYRVTISVASMSPTMDLFVGTSLGGSSILSASYASAGTLTAYFLAVGTTTYVQLLNGYNATDVINSFSCKSIAGNHRYQPTSANRPVWSARYNLLLATASLSTQSVTTDATNYVLYFTGSGTVTLSGTSTGTLSAGSNTITCTAGTLTLTVTGSVLTADLRPANQAVGLLPQYQAVVTASNYDSVGFPAGLRWNGSNSWMQNASTDFSGTNKVSVFVGVRKLAASGYQQAISLSVNDDANPGTFGIYTPASGANYAAYLQGATSQIAQTATTFTAPITNTLSVALDLGASSIATKVNGATPSIANGGSGTGGGNFGNYPAYFGARAGSSLFFNGLTFSNIAIGIALSASQIAAFEAWTNSKARAY